MLPEGSRWAVLKNNNKQYEPISLSVCKNWKGEWLCLQSTWNTKFTQSWPIVSIPMNNNIWYMGKGHFAEKV